MFSRLFKPFVELAGSPRGLWYVIGAFAFDSMAYFGILLLMTVFFREDLGWPDQYAALVVSMFTMLVTLSMLGLGSFAERFTLRRAVAVALLLGTAGRALYCSLPWLPWQPVLCVVALVIVATGSGILQPACYAGVKRYTDERTNSMGYAAIYALMNLSIVVIGGLSSLIRPRVQAVLDGKADDWVSRPFFAFFTPFSRSGVQAVNWICMAITGLTLVWFLMVMTRRVEADAVRPHDSARPGDGPQPPLRERLRSYFVDGPFSNARFLFFIFMLLPVRTLFAHQWLTMPEYVLRSYSKGVADNMELLVDWINPLIIFFAVPIVAVATKRFHVYTMMIVGSLVSAAPTFLLCAGPNLSLLLAYFVFFSIGEALWSARFLEYASELAPPGRVAQYMGLAQIPWLLAKGTTGLYSGYLLSTYCPEELPPPEQLHTSTLWLIYGLIAMLSPIGLWLARKWVRQGLHAPGETVIAEAVLPVA